MTQDRAYMDWENLKTWQHTRDGTEHNVHISLTYSILVPTHLCTLLVRLCRFDFYLRHRGCDLFICSQISGSSPTNIDDPDSLIDSLELTLHPFPVWVLNKGNQSASRRRAESHHWFILNISFNRCCFFPPLSGFKMSPDERSEKCVASRFPGSCLSIGRHQRAAQVRVVLDTPVW